MSLRICCFNLKINIIDWCWIQVFESMYPWYFRNGTYVAKDYCMRAFVEIEPLEPTSPKVSPALLTALPLKPHLFTCTLMNNARGKQSELLLSAESESDRERWLSAMRPPTVSKLFLDFEVFWFGRDHEAVLSMNCLSQCFVLLK